MKNIFQSLLLVIAGATQKELARQVKYLKVENQILRSRLPKRILVTPKERTRLIKFAQNLGGKVLRQLATIVSPEPLLGWIRAEKKPKPTKRKRGRPNTPEQIRELILLMARENQWGYTAGDPEAKTEAVKQGTYNLDFGKAWIKSPSLTGGQAPVVKYSRDLMMAILWDRMPYLSEVVNTEVIPLEKAPEAHRAFDEGSPKKFILDPHGSVRG